MLRPEPSALRPAMWPTGGYLVGGAVRDLLLGYTPHDFDWLVPDPAGAARRMAGEAGGAVVALDTQRGYWRAILKTAQQGSVQHDFAPQPAELLTELLRRDFTVNALALGADGELLDPSGGQADLAARQLRMLSAANLRADPLRLLRAVRLAATRELQLEVGTAQAIRRLAHARLPLPAAERVSAELEQLLQSPQAARGLQLLRELHLLALYLPELAPIAGYKPVVVAPFAPSRALLWAALFAPLLSGQESQAVARQARARLEALRLPRATCRRIAGLLLALPIPALLSRPAARAYVYFHRALLPEVLLLDEGLQGQRAAASRQQIRRAWQQQPTAPAALLSAQEVSHLLNVTGAPLGAALRALAYAQEVEPLATPQQAREFLRRWAVGAAKTPPA